MLVDALIRLYAYVACATMEMTVSIGVYGEPAAMLIGLADIQGLFVVGRSPREMHAASAKISASNAYAYEEVRVLSDWRQYAATATSGVPARADLSVQPWTALADDVGPGAGLGGRVRRVWRVGGRLGDRPVGDLAAARDESRTSQ